ncbi:hypothetical protein CSAL01_10513 [Colletotrichum salicis]|uniref:Uncharacterized protein n=1 Tax=Colletotrichum salicis TaxID=1209931 RepID=A0A135V7C6_9PEZI|nr:hypothetical protein CSAL01_10513 [Colletotrichum salicis]
MYREMNSRPSKSLLRAPTRADMPKRQRRRDLPARLVKRPRYEDEADQLRGDRWVGQLTAGLEDEGACGGGLDGDVEEEGEFSGLH